MRTFIYGMLTTSLLILGSLAQADIHRCTDADGGIVFQQTPCVEPDPEQEKTGQEPPAKETAADVDADAIETQVEPVEPKSAEVQAQCKQKYRDAIDAIDAEMRERYTPEQAEDYKQRLRALTGKLRSC